MSTKIIKNYMDKHIIEKIFEYKDSVNSIQELAIKCNSTRPTITKYCNLLKIEVDFKIDSSNMNSLTYALVDILDGKYPQYPTSKLRRRLVKEGYKENKCEKCQITNWNNEYITFQVDHINGINNDHRLINLRLLCPNCHSQTKTYGSKNIKRKRK